MTETPANPPADPISEGAHARSHGRPKDSCPYPVGSDAREAWLEGYDGVPSERAPGLPPNAC